jgi:hypothetical protein
VVRTGETILYSRRQNILNRKFHYIAKALDYLPSGTVIYNLALRLGVPIKGVLKQVEGIEVFPRQEELGADKFGNAIRAR